PDAEARHHLVEPHQERQDRLSDDSHDRVHLSLRYRVISTFSERMAPAEPAQSQPSALGESETIDRLGRVRRAGRLITTILSEKRRAPALVPAARGQAEASGELLGHTVASTSSASVSHDTS